MTDCIFCKIAQGQIPSKIAYEDESVMAFYDQDPQAPVHVLVIPKEHIASAMEITPENSQAVAKIFEAIPKIAADLGLENGFRVVNNCGKDGMQTVQHLHFHLLGKKKMGWPPYPPSNPGGTSRSSVTLEQGKTRVAGESGHTGVRRPKAACAARSSLPGFLSREKGKTGTKRPPRTESFWLELNKAAALRRAPRQEALCQAFLQERKEKLEQSAPRGQRVFGSS